jgi:hypothetical protein
LARRLGGPYGLFVRCGEEKTTTIAFFQLLAYLPLIYRIVLYITLHLKQRRKITEDGNDMWDVKFLLRPWFEFTSCGQQVAESCAIIPNSTQQSFS